MSAERIEIRRRSLLAARAAAAAPRVGVYALIGILALAGARTILRPLPAAPRPVRPTPPHDLAAEAFAQSFARAYLTWDAANQDDYDRRISGYLSQSLASDAELVVPQRGARHVDWTLAVADESSTQGRRTIVVEVATDAGATYVAVPVSRAPDGALSVSGFPALVGPPTTDLGATPPSEQDVSDSDLETVARRAIANYLAAATSNLRADLTPDAAVTVPAQPLALRSVERITWAAHGTVAVELTAAGADGTAWTLRYELRVVKRDRWYVAAVELDPRKEGDS